MEQNQLLKKLRDGKTLTFRQQLLLIVQLSIPGILAQISEIIMEYIKVSQAAEKWGLSPIYRRQRQNGKVTA